MATSSASSSASIIEDIMRLIPPDERAAFREVLRCELQQYRQPLPAAEMRRIAVHVWHRFCKHGWPRAT
jgi:hypothetical protein